MNDESKEIAFVIFIASIALIGGVILGMMIQQVIFVAGTVKFGESLEGVTLNVEVDINETKLVNGFTEILIPFLNQTINEEKANE